MTNFDIMNPMISSISKGLDGKVITLMGSNSTGKTKQATRMNKPFYLGFEKGIRAIANIPFLPINNWRDFVKVNKQLTDPKTIDAVKEKYQTIIFDEVYTSALYCQDFVCRKHGVETIGEGNGGFGLWKEYEKTYWDQLDKLLSAGFTLVFISHVEENKEGKFLPKGDKRSIKPVIDNSDLCVFLSPNGIDEDGKVIKSTAWLAETDKFFARSRFDYIDTSIPEFTAETLEQAIAQAITRQEEAEGIVAVSYNEQKESYASEKIVFEDVIAEVNAIGGKLANAGFLEDLLELVEFHLGVGKKVADAKPAQLDMLSLLLDDVKDLAADKLSNE